MGIYPFLGINLKSTLGQTHYFRSKQRDIKPQGWGSKIRPPHNTVTITHIDPASNRKEVLMKKRPKWLIWPFLLILLIIGLVFMEKQTHFFHQIWIIYFTTISITTSTLINCHGFLKWNRFCTIIRQQSIRYWPWIQETSMLV